jgi:hypothetical protein
VPNVTERKRLMCMSESTDLSFPRSLLGGGNGAALYLQRSIPRPLIEECLFLGRRNPDVEH